MDGYVRFLFATFLEMLCHFPLIPASQKLVRVLIIASAVRHMLGIPVGMVRNPIVALRTSGEGDLGWGQGGEGRGVGRSWRRSGLVVVLHLFT